jgi:hypothetical protein
MGTLITYPRSDGMTFSEGKALMASEEGEIVTHLSLKMVGYELVTSKVQNIDSSFYSTNSTITLSSLNNMVSVWEDELNPATGIAHANTWKLQ